VYFLFRQPVAEPPGDAKPWTEIYMELAERLGILQDVYRIGNDAWNLGEAYKIDPAKQYSLPTSPSARRRRSSATTSGSMP